MTKMLLVAILVAVMVPMAWAINCNTHSLSVSYEVAAINEVCLSRDAVSLVVLSAIAGQAPNQASASSTYNITTNTGETSKKLVGSLCSDMPSGLTLKAEASAPSGASSTGAQTITSTPADLVTGIHSVVGNDLPIAFTLDAAVGAGVVSQGARTFTLTLTDN
jgi:hypothetical protein